MVKKNPASGAKTAMAKAGAAPKPATDPAAKKPRNRKAATSAAEAVPQEAGVAWGLAGNQTTVEDETTAEGKAGERTAEGKAPQTESQVQTDGGGKVTGPGSNIGSIRTDLMPSVEAIERLREEMATLKEDEKEFFAVLKTKGYSAKYLRKVIARRAMDPDDRRNEDDMIAMYEAALAEGDNEDDE